jgi:hypothetical protein
MVGCSIESCGYTPEPSACAKPQIRASCAFQEGSLAKPNYKFQKRQKDLAKQKKKEEKRLKKAARTGEQPSDDAPLE